MWNGLPRLKEIAVCFFRRIHCNILLQAPQVGLVDCYSLFCSLSSWVGNNNILTIFSLPPPFPYRPTVVQLLQKKKRKLYGSDLKILTWMVRLSPSTILFSIFVLGLPVIQGLALTICSSKQLGDLGIYPSWATFFCICPTACLFSICSFPSIWCLAGIH